MGGLTTRQRTKNAIFYLLMFALPLAVVAALPFAYYAVQKILYPYHYCGSYGRVDGELGWTLAPDAQSCMSMGNWLDGKTYFSSTIFTDGLGFRSQSRSGEPPAGGVVTIGDSWTFGYAVDYEQSYPYHLAQMTDLPVVNLGVPAYGSAQAFLLLERHAARLKPRAVVYLNQGLWARSICEGRGENTLLPCLRAGPAPDAVELVKPRAGFVAAQAARGIYPGGYLTAGNTTWGYFVLSRPWALGQKILAAAAGRLGLSGGNDMPGARPAAMHAFTLRRFLDLARAQGFVFILVDPEGDYRQPAAEAGADAPLVYMGPPEWRAEVAAPSRALPPEQVRVPKDGHYADGMNRLIAAAVAKRLAAVTSR
ncbi:MAG: hypothetical protein WCF16_04255 [Alphaproteobacteria bacterium]